MATHPATLSMLAEKQTFDANNDEDRKQIVNATLHAMDLGNVAFPWEECVPWARRVGQEFAEQVEKERAAKMDVSAFMDVKGDVELAKLQVGFVSFLIKPFFEKVAFHIKEFEIALNTCKDNVDRWKLINDGSHHFESDSSSEMKAKVIEAAPTAVDTDSTADTLTTTPTEQVAAEAETSPQP